MEILDIVLFALPYLVILKICFFGFLISTFYKRNLTLPWIFSIGIILFSVEGILLFVLSHFSNINLKIVSLFFIIIFTLLLLKNLRQFIHFFDKKEISIYLLIFSFIWIFTYLPIKPPAEFYDGPYVWKDWNLVTKLQRGAVDYPPDNAIPAIAASYLFKNISFNDFKPIAPGQEVGNRPILLSFAALGPKYLIQPHSNSKTDLPSFEYVGQLWPDGLSSVSDLDFRIFLATALPFNSSIFFLFLWYLKRFNNKSPTRYTYFIVSLLGLAPIFVFHTFFTWPKNVAAFFACLGTYLFFQSRIKYRMLLSGLYLSIAFLFHPLVITLILLLLPILIYRLILKRLKIYELLAFSLIIVTLIGGWFYWAVVVIKSNFDLISQNTLLDKSLAGLIWIRFYNLFSLLPGNLVNFVPFTSKTFFHNNLASLTLILGVPLLAVLPKIKKLMQLFKDNPDILPLFLFGISITMIFSYPISTINHGWQATWPILSCLIFSLLQGLPNKIRNLVLILQFLYILIFYTVWFVEIL